MRLFIALPISPIQQKAAAYMVSRYKHKIHGVKWVKESAMHLTLKFLGEVDSSSVDRITSEMAASLEHFSPYELGLHGVGVFPSPARARVLWAGVKPGAVDAAAMAEAIDEKMIPLGFKSEKRKFTTHLTLGRLRYPAPENVIKALLEEERDFLAQAALIREVILYRSDLNPHGAVYTPLYRHML